MRSGAAAGHRGYFHETAFYGRDEDFLAIVVPFFADGLAAGEPVVSAFGPYNQSLVRDVFGERDGVRFVDGGVQYTRPATAIRRYRELLAGYVAAGVRQIRVAGDVPHPGVGAPWDWWARYEAAVNHAYEDFPLWGLCPYDTRTTPPGVIEDVRRTHPHVAGPDGSHRANPGFEDPARFLAGRTAGWRDPLEAGPPTVELTDPGPGRVREVVAAVSAGTDVSREDVEGLQLAATEAVTNGVVHGAPPVTMRVWRARTRLVVAVHDRGPGPDQPYLGLLPPVDLRDGGGFGLWLAHQVCSHVALDREPGGFTVRLVAGVAEA